MASNNSCMHYFVQASMHQCNHARLRSCTNSRQSFVPRGAGAGLPGRARDPCVLPGLQSDQPGCTLIWTDILETSARRRQDEADWRSITTWKHISISTKGISGVTTHRRPPCKGASMFAVVLGSRSLADYIGQTRKPSHDDPLGMTESP
jgi:hypothetical protein